MEFRKAIIQDVDDIYAIIKQAQEYLKNNDINQWQNNYPNPQVIEQDIRNEECYVLVEENHAVATAVISFDGEPTYDRIYDGKWQSSGDYAVMHRVAVDSSMKGQGLFGVLVDKTEEMCIKREIFSIRVDTHKDNRSMQTALYKQGFTYCGIIYLEDGNERVAFEKLL